MKDSPELIKLFTPDYTYEAKRPWHRFDKGDRTPMNTFRRYVGPPLRGKRYKGIQEVTAAALMFVETTAVAIDSLQLTYEGLLKKQPVPEDDANAAVKFLTGWKDHMHAGAEAGRVLSGELIARFTLKPPERVRVIGRLYDSAHEAAGQVMSNLEDLWSLVSKCSAPQGTPPLQILAALPAFLSAMRGEFATDFESLLLQIRREHLHARSAISGNEAGADGGQTSPNDVDQDLFVFRKVRGGAWEIRWHNQQILCPSIRGFAYIHRLLSKPSTQISAVELMTDEPDLEAALRKHDPQVDLTALRQLKERLGETTDASERGQIEEYIRRSRGLNGRARNLADQIESMRKSVQQAIDRALVRIRRELPGCANHLSTYIRTGADPAYIPADPAPDWTL